MQRQKKKLNKKQDQDQNVRKDFSKKMKTKSLIRWLFGCLIFFVSCRHASAPAVSSPATADISAARRAKIDTVLSGMKKMVRSGDVVTRTGNDFTSQSLRSLNRRDQTFSHCGIASIEHDSLFIYHALGGEWNPDQALMRESFEGFTDPVDNRAAGIFRFNIKEQYREKLISTVQELYLEKIKFDLAFDLKTDDKLYCAEFVYKSFLRATDSTVRFNHSFIRDFEFIGVDDIILHPLCRKIAVFNYGIY